MDFLLKKIVSLFLMPLPLGVALITLGLFFLYRNQIGRAKFTLALSIFWFFIFSYAPIPNLLLNRIESGYPVLKQAPANIRYIYVLGSSHRTDETLPITSQLSTEAVVRLDEAIRLYQQLHGKAKLILSGYSGLYDHTPHALMQERLALSLGINKKNLILRPEPRDTEEEAIAAKKLLGKTPFILVTSAYHMKRAMRWFRREGLDPLPAPTFHQTSIRHLHYSDLFTPIALMKSRLLFHELLGTLWQKLKDI
jgi:uncharacterized SAM-binding protein YcdF (DUF218 family)